MRLKRWALGCSVVAGATLAQFAMVPTASSFVYFQTKTAPPKPWRWWKRSKPLVFHVAQVTPQEVPLDQVPTIMQAAHDVWTDTTCGVVPEVEYAGPMNVTAATPPEDTNVEADNVIVFVESTVEWSKLGHSQSMLAITKVFADPDTGEIIDADMEINDGGFKFTIDDTPDESGEVDFIGTMIHESGHFLGMDHSLDATATMNASYIAATAVDPHPQRSLEADDITGICQLYTNVPDHVDPNVGGTDPGGGCAGGGESAAMLTVATSLVAIGARRRRGA